MKNNKSAKYDNSGCIIYAFSIFFVLFVIFFLYSSKFKVAYSEGNIRRWQIKNNGNGIKEISISIDTFFEIVDDSQNRFEWHKIKKIYLNRKMINPSDYIYEKDIVMKKCNIYFILLPKKSIDSVVYKFSPKYIYEEYNSERELIFSTSEFSSKYKLNKKYSHLLPSCAEIYFKQSSFILYGS